MSVKTYTTEEYFNKYNQMPPIRRQQAELDETSKATRGFADSMLLASKPTPNFLQRQLTGIVKDMPDDFMQMGRNIKDRIAGRAEKTGANIARRQEEGAGLKGAFGTGLDWATDTIRGTAIAIEEAGLFALKQFTTQEQEEAILESVGSKVEQGLEFAEEKGIADDVRRLVAGYNRIKEEHPELIGAGENTAQIVGTFAEMFGIGKGTTYGAKAVDQATDVIQKTAPKIQDSIETAARKTGAVVDAGLVTRRASQLAKQEEKVQTAVGRILQAGDNPRAIEQATRALTDIDIKNIKTYDDLNNTLADRITVLSRQVDERLRQDNTLYKPAQLSKTTKVGDELIAEDPVRNALQGLENAYTQSGEPVNATRIRQLTQKYDNEGLSLVEVNNIAREYGIEFKNRAFTKLGEPKQGYNADMYENTRKAVKDVLRTQLPDDLTKQLDMKMSDVYTTLDLTKKIENTVAKLEQRITRRTLGQKVGGAVTDVADMLTGGFLRGAVNKLLPSNVGNKTMNSLEIQKELRKNLKELQKLQEIKGDKAFAVAMEDYVKNMQPGMSIRNTVPPPDDVAKNLSLAEYRTIKEYLANPADTTFNPKAQHLMEKLGIKKIIELDDTAARRYMQDVVDEFDRVENAGAITIGKPAESFNKGATPTQLSAKEAKASGMSFDDWVKGQGETLFHGSSEKFDVFDPKKYGTGEGGDLFGRGAYLTNNKDLGNFYANVVSKKSFVEKYVPGGPLGSDVPVYKANADTLAAKKAVVNEFISDNMKMFDVSKEAVDDGMVNIFVKDLQTRGLSKSEALEEVNRALNYARNNKEKIKGYRGELDYLIKRHPETGELVADELRRRGYDGVKYLSDTAFEGSGGINYVVYRPEKLKTRSQLKAEWDAAN
jgi:hypothetical protein